MSDFPSAQLEGDPGNPIPPGAEVALVPTDDGRLLRTASWHSGSEPARGTVLILQGRAEFIEKYAETTSELRARGFAVLAFDWRGQGFSDRALTDPRFGHVGDFAEYRRDVEAVARAKLDGMPRPHLGLAHSMGGCVALTGASQGWLPVERLVLSAPMVELRIVRHPRLVRAAVRLLRLAGAGRRPVPGGTGASISLQPFPGNRLSGDPGRYARNAAVAARIGAGAVGAPTVAWLESAYRAMDGLSLPQAAAALGIPTLFAAGGDDPVCSTPAIERFAAATPGARIVRLAGARHEILMETDAIRAQFWAAFDGFVTDLPAPSA